MKKVLFILSFCLYTILLHAQEDRDRALAYQYYRNGDFDKSIELFEKLYNDNPSLEYYQQLFSSYNATKDYSAMEKLASKQAKKDRHDARYLIDLGYAYKLENKEKKATELYDDIIKNLLPEESFITSTAQHFEEYRNFDYALQTYEKGNKLLRDPLYYAFDIASIYFIQNKNPEAIVHLLDYIKGNPDEFDKVYAYLQSEQNKSEVFKELENQLYDRIQKSPNDEVYAEVLIWLKLQQKDFASALIYAKSLDKRNNEAGERILQIAYQAIDAEAYNDAINALEYILQKGDKSPFLLSAKMLLLETRKDKILSGFSYTNEELTLLKNDYLNFISVYGKSPATAKTICDLAKIEALYMHDLDGAIEQLTEVIALIGLNRDVKNKAKLDLGDYYVMNGEYWESTLLYSQVDKEDKDGIIGEEARFKNAKLSYYKGEFEWAQAQLDVLKGSTSELIANDALQLSVFIIDNSGLDTIYTPMQMFANADLLIFQNKFDAAIQTMDSIPRLFPNHSLSDDIFMAKAKIALKKLNYDEAITWLNYIVKSETYKKDILGDDATYMLAGIYEKYKKDIPKAMDYYKAIMLDYKDSVYLTEARKKFRLLRGDKLEEKDN
ncbi:MAG: tetratricopeptide repeat protein [Bacteroidota bacterium]